MRNLFINFERISIFSIFSTAGMRVLAMQQPAAAQQILGKSSFLFDIHFFVQEN
jgi:hypothetical protein